jgi:hypothetical protein
MIRFFFNIILFISTILILAFLNISLSYLLPLPYSAANFPFIAFVFYIISRESGAVVWFAFFSYFVIELFVGIPFGILLFSSTFATLFTYWLYKHIITNKSLYAALILLTSGIIAFRFLYLLLIFLVTLFGLVDPSWNQIMVKILWELLFSNIVFSLFYPFFYIFVRNKRTYIQ